MSALPNGDLCKCVFRRTRVNRLFASITTVLVIATSSLGASDQVPSSAITQGSNNSDPGMPFWRQIMAERKPVVSFRLSIGVEN